MNLGTLLTHLVKSLPKAFTPTRPLLKVERLALDQTRSLPVGIRRAPLSGGFGCLPIIAGWNAKVTTHLNPCSVTLFRTCTVRKTKRTNNFHLICPAIHIHL